MDDAVRFYEAAGSNVYRYDDGFACATATTASSISISISISSITSTRPTTAPAATYRPERRGVACPIPCDGDASLDRRVAAVGHPGILRSQPGKRGGASAQGFFDGWFELELLCPELPMLEVSPIATSVDGCRWTRATRAARRRPGGGSSSRRGGSCRCAGTVRTESRASSRNSPTARGALTCRLHNRSVRQRPQRIISADGLQVLADAQVVAARGHDTIGAAPSGSPTIKYCMRANLTPS